MKMASVFFVGVLHAADPVASPPKTKEAAQIGQEVITQEDILLQMQRDLGDGVMQLRKTNAAQFAQYYKLYRDQIVGMHLLTTEALQHETRLIDDPKVKEQLEQMKKSFLVNAFVSQYVEKKITPESLREAFEKNPQEMVTLSRIVVDDESRAKSIIIALKTRPFSELAAKYSKDKRAAKDGSTQPILLARLDGKLRAHIAGLKKGSHSQQPFEIGGKWFVIKLDNKAKADFGEAKPVLRDFVAMKELQLLMASLRKKEHVKLFDLDGKETKDSLLSPPSSSVASVA